MKKIFFGLASFFFLVSAANATKVTTCMSYLVGATSKMECSGDYSGKTTMVELYKLSWKYAGDISGTNRFVLVFEKK